MARGFSLEALNSINNSQGRMIDIPGVILLCGLQGVSVCKIQLGLLVPLIPFCL